MAQTPGDARRKKNAALQSKIKTEKHNRPAVVANQLIRPSLADQLCYGRSQMGQSSHLNNIVTSICYVCEQVNADRHLCCPSGFVRSTFSGRTVLLIIDFSDGMILFLLPSIWG